MLDQIKDLLEKITFHENQHKVTIFNKQKNTKNTISHNAAQGKLIQQLKKLSYFNEQNQNLGTQYLLKTIQYIQPLLLRKDCVLINHQKRKKCNDIQHPQIQQTQTEYLLCDGIIAVYENNHSQQQQIHYPPNSKKHFKEYILSDSIVSFMNHPESINQLVAHQDCHLLKLPTKSQLDPNKTYQQVQQVNQFIARNPQFYNIKNRLIKLSQEVIKQKETQFDPAFGLGLVDFNEFLSRSIIKRHQAHQKLCQVREEVHFIGLIIKGKVIADNINKRNKKILSNDDTLLTFYKNNYSHQKTKLQKNQTLFQQGEWIGLEEYLKHLENNPFKVETILKKLSKQQNNKQQRDIKEVYFLYEKQYRAKEDCEILWVPILHFAKKMNYQTNFSILTKWVALMNLKQQIKQKNDNIHEKLEVNKNENPQISNHQFPKLHSKFEKLAHNSGLETITELRSKIISEKRKQNPHNSLHKEIKIPQNSLLGITIRNRESIDQAYQNYDLSIELPKFKGFSHSFRSPKEVSNNKKLNLGLTKRGKTQRVNNSLSQRKIDVSVKEVFSHEKDSVDGLIMYPDAYQPKKLSPDLRKQMFYAQKTWRLSSLNSSKKNNLQGRGIDRQRGISFNSQNSSHVVTNRLSSIGSKESLHNSMISTPESLYSKLIQQISFKYPELDEKLRVQKFIKKRNQMIQKVTLKQRIQTLKVLGNIDRKRRIRESRQRKNELIIEQNAMIKNNQKQQLYNLQQQSQSIIMKK